MLAAGGIEARVAVEPVEMTPGEEAVLAFAVREGVTNVVRHSRASSCSVSLAREEGVLRLTISDDGKWKRALDGTGLAGMRERVDAIGGRLTILRTAGTVLTIELTHGAPQLVQPSATVNHDNRSAPVHGVA